MSGSGMWICNLNCSATFLLDTLSLTNVNGGQHRQLLHAIQASSQPCCILGGVLGIIIQMEDNMALARF